MRSFYLMIYVLFLASCTINNVDFTKLYDAGTHAMDLGDKSLEEEIQIGDEVANTLLAQYSLSSNKSMHSYVNKVGTWLALQTERPELTWYFAVLEDESFNAYAAPGGYVFLTTGLLAQLESESELAGVLAHEIAHVIQRHHLMALKSKAAVGMATNLLAFGAQLYQAGRAQDNYDDSNYGEDNYEDPAYQGQSESAMEQEQLVNSINNLYGKGLDRDDEYSADRMAVVIAARAGYEPYAFYAVLQKLASNKGATTHLDTLLKTHPHPSDRIEQLKSIYNSPQLAQVEGLELKKRFYQYIR